MWFDTKCVTEFNGLNYSLFNSERFSAWFNLRITTVFKYIDGKMGITSNRNHSKSAFRSTEGGLVWSSLYIWFLVLSFQAPKTLFGNCVEIPWITAIGRAEIHCWRITASPALGPRPHSYRPRKGAPYAMQRCSLADLWKHESIIRIHRDLHGFQ